MREVFGAGFRHRYHVLNAHAEPARQIDPRLHRDHHAREQCGGIGRGKARPFVDLHAHAVTGAVAERARVVLFDDVAGRLVNRRADSSRLGRSKGGKLCVEYGLIYAALILRDLPHRDGAGHIGMVAVKQRADVHRYEIAGLDLFL